MPTTFRTSFRNVVYDVLKARGWKETEGMDWDFHWAEKDDGGGEEAQKYDFWPQTYVLPGDYALFAEEFKRGAGGDNVWIMKPVGRSQGKGIFIFTKISQISKWKSESRWRLQDDDRRDKPEKPDAETYVVQKYVNNPYLIGGKKFDLRLYVLVTSYMPLTVWMYRSGFCRFSTKRYSKVVNSKGDIDNQLMHLTNVAIQKKSDDYDASTGGGKWELLNMKLFLMSVIIADKHCFELYGYDILFDDAFKPWLLEVNAGPSMTANTPDDHDLKYAMLDSLLDIIDVDKKLSGDEVRVGGFDLVFKDGEHVGPGPGSLYTTMLGTDVPSDPHIVKRPPKPPPPPDQQAQGAKAGAVNTVALRGSRRISSKKDRAPPVPRLLRRRPADVVTDDGRRPGPPRAPRLTPAKPRGSSSGAGRDDGGTRLPLATSSSR
ncbi:hypothetical protein JL720_13988 [Aureococcus anophagefferens]|nr:hypothetical protein JL720_13988 [Aureococcus anophagefferens]